MMKRIFALMLAALTLFALAACGDKSDDSKSAEPSGTANEPTEPAEATEADGGDVIDGGYADADSPVVTDEIRELVAKATQDLDGAAYEPVAYLESQVVAGMNHVILCKVTPVVPDAASTYAIVTIYADLEGSAEITAVENSTVTAPEPYDPENPMAGAYGEPESPEVTDEAKTALEKACEELDGVEYKPVALLATQVVAGRNYRLLCKATVVSPDAASTYAIVTVYADLEGGAEITDVRSFTAAG